MIQYKARVAAAAVVATKKNKKINKNKAMTSNKMNNSNNKTKTLSKTKERLVHSIKTSQLAYKPHLSLKLMLETQLLTAKLKI